MLSMFLRSNCLATGRQGTGVRGVRERGNKLALSIYVKDVRASLFFTSTCFPHASPHFHFGDHNSWVSESCPKIFKAWQVCRAVTTKMWNRLFCRNQNSDVSCQDPNFTVPAFNKNKIGLLFIQHQFCSPPFYDTGNNLITYLYMTGFENNYRHPKISFKILL